MPLEGTKAIDALIDGNNTITSTHARTSVPNSGWAFDTMDAAKWAMTTTHAFYEGMLAAVNLGGDSDSIGAVYGQLAGAFYGYKRIPGEWVFEVKDYKKIGELIDMFIEKT